MIKIDKNIEIPKKYPFENMEIGDSFEVSKESPVNYSSYLYGKKHNKKFIVKTIGDKKRVWRIK